MELCRQGLTPDKFQRCKKLEGCDMKGMQVQRGRNPSHVTTWSGNWHEQDERKRKHEEQSLALHEEDIPNTRRTIYSHVWRTWQHIILSYNTWRHDATMQRSKEQNGTCGRMPPLSFCICQKYNWTAPICSSYFSAPKAYLACWQLSKIELEQHWGSMCKMPHHQFNASSNRKMNSTMIIFMIFYPKSI